MGRWFTMVGALLLPCLMSCSTGGGGATKTTSSGYGGGFAMILDANQGTTGNVYETTGFVFTLDVVQGVSAAYVQSITLSNTAQFSLSSNCTNVYFYAYSSGCSFTVNFSPTATGTYSTTVTASNSAGAVSLTLTATAVNPPVALGVLSPTSLNFSQVTPNTVSAAQTVQLTNVGATSLAISSVVVLGTNASSFAESNGCPASLATNASCNISVTMDPSATSSSYSAYLFVRDNSASVGPVQQVQLAGTSNANGPAPALTITPASLDFTGTPVGATVTKSVTLSNIGAGPLTLALSAQLYSSTYATTCGAVLNAGSSCTVSVTFRPVAAGTDSGEILLTDNAAGSPQTVPVTATAVQPVLTLSPASVSFSNVAPNTSAVQNVTLTNTGGEVLNFVGALQLAANTSPVLKMTSSCGASLQPNAACVLSFTFSPTASGTGYLSSVTITSNASVPQVTIPVTAYSTGYTKQDTLYVLPDNGVAWLYALVTNATSSIELANYELSDSMLLADLQAACNRGVRVRVLLDGMASNVPAYAALNGAGANCSAVYASAQFPVMDESVLIADQQQIAVMTMNLTSFTYAKNRDFAWVNNDIYDIAAAETTFNLDYAGTTPATYVPSPGTDLVWNPDAQNTLLKEIGNATSSLYIESDSTLSPAVANAIAGACQSVSNNPNSSPFYPTIVVPSTASFTGAEITELEDYCAPAGDLVLYVNPKVHGTTVIVDNTVAVIASTSLDDAAGDVNRGLGAVVVTTYTSPNIDTLVNAVSADIQTGVPYF